MDFKPEDVPTIAEVRAAQHERWRETEETIAKWEDLIWVEALQIIHGKDEGLARYKWLRMGGPDPYASPE